MTGDLGGEVADGGPGRIRASDQDREKVASALTAAMSEGRLSSGELQDRLTEVYRAKTLGELEPLTRDLPGHQLVLPAASGQLSPTPGQVTGRMPLVGGVGTSTTAVAIFGGARRRGRWVVPSKFTAVAVWGGVELDLTEAKFAAGEVTITAVAIMGAVDITVPDGVVVKVEGVGIMGAFEDDTPGQPEPGSGAPVLRVNGAALMGGVRVKRADAPELPPAGRPELRKRDDR